MSQVNTINLLGAFAPPEGYELAGLVATTYSLNPTVLLALLASCALPLDEKSQSHNLETLSKEERIEIVTKALTKCVLLCDHHGRFETTKDLSVWDKLSLDSVIKFAGRDSHKSGSLHSKIILAVYKNHKESVCGRLYIGSKNLTLSNCKEFGAIYDLQPNQNKVFHRDLISFLKYVSSEEVNNNSSSNHLTIRFTNIIQMVQKNALSVADQSLRFFWQGRFTNRNDNTIANQLKDVLAKPWNSLYIHSPWSRKDAVHYFLNTLPNNCNIYVKCLHEPRLSTVKSDRVEYLFSTSTNGEVASWQSHAKIYLLLKGQKVGMLFGSANCTKDALGIGPIKNTEILLYTEKDLSTYKELCFTGHHEETEKIPQYSDKTADKVLCFINSIQIQVTLLKHRNVLKYEINAAESPKVSGLRLTIDHELLEPVHEKSENETTNSMRIFTGNTLPDVLEFNLPSLYKHRISRLLTITGSWRNGSISTHLLVDLDPSLYEGRENLSALQFKKSELIQSLADALNISIPDEDSEPQETGQGGSQSIFAILEGIRIERYALAMAKLKIRQPLVFISRINRTNRLLEKVEKSPDFKDEIVLKELVSSLRSVHVLLD